MSKTALNGAVATAGRPCQSLAIRLDRLIKEESNRVKTAANAHLPKARIARLESKVAKLEREIADLTATVTAMRLKP